MNFLRPWSRSGPPSPERTQRSTVFKVLALLLGVVLALAGIGVVRSEWASASSGVKYAGRTTASHPGATRKVTLEKPAGTAAGDVLVASFTAAGGAAVSAAPTGWTSLIPGRLRAGPSASVFAYVRVVTAADARTSSWTWTLGKLRAWSGGVARYEGVDRAHPVDAKVSVASSRSPKSGLAVPGVTTTTSGTMLVGGVGATAGKSTLSPPKGWAESWEAARGPTSEHAYRLQDAAGKTARWTWKVSSASRLAGWVAALRPAAAGPQNPTPTTPTPTTGTAPTASFTASPSQGRPPLSVAFTDTSTGAPTSWAWDFGDGTTGTTQSPLHTYLAAGTYTVSLRVANASGSNTATRPAAVTVGAELPAVLVGAGDIAACDLPEDSATAALVSATAGTVFALGDNAYPNGTAADYASCYEPTWGAFKDRTRPVVGNHEYLSSSTAAPYFAYFGGAAGEAGKGWYSYDVGTDWHVVVLNSNCTIVGCTAGSPQEQWLRADLAASTRPCTVAMWHHPRFSSGEHGNDASTDAFWRALYADGAELVLNGHDHDYERFAPQNPSAVADPTYGLREFVVGTGGKDFRSFSSTLSANSEVHSIAAHGVLKLTLNSNSFDWSFLAIPGTTLNESGTGTCHGAPPALVGASAE